MKTSILVVDDETAFLDSVVRMLRLARWLPAGRDMDEWLESMRSYLHHEIDYAREAHFAGAIGGRLTELDALGRRYHAPAIYEDYSSARVLALEYVQGKAVTDPNFTTGACCRPIPTSAIT